MQLYKCILTNNPCYKANRGITPKGIMVHSTGANNPNLKRYIQPIASAPADAYDPNATDLLALLGTNKYSNDWNHISENACVHAFIGKLADGSVATVQTLPWTQRGWHAGTGTAGKTANDTHISFEICEDNLTDPVYFRQTKDQAVELTAMLCKLYDLDPVADGVVICHADGYKRGIASNHGDIYTWWNKHNYTMDDFRQEVLSAMLDPEPDEGDNMTYYATINDVPEWYRPSVQKVIDAGVMTGYDGKGGIYVSEDLCRILTILDHLGKL